MGSGKGYLCAFLSMRYGLQVFGIDSSSTNTRGAHERNRKLKKYSRAYQKHGTANGNQRVSHMYTRSTEVCNSEVDNSGTTALGPHPDQEHTEQTQEEKMVAEAQCCVSSVVEGDTNGSKLETSESTNSASENLFLTTLAVDVFEQASKRVHPSHLSTEERERRKRENLERKARDGKGSRDNSNLYSPLTSYVTAETELRTIIDELEVRIRNTVSITETVKNLTLKWTAAAIEYFNNVVFY